LAGLEFKREERLKSKKVLGALFKGGNSYVAYPLRVVWAPIDLQEIPTATQSAQVAISVPKRFFKSAVDRNLLKRRIREAYRLNKPTFYQKLEAQQQPIALMLMYIAKEPLSYAEIEAGMLKMIRKFPGIKVSD
jgi:ribonuclease P protein component